jgi:uncharacterized repeat protein (TIGR02543 family)
MSVNKLDIFVETEAITRISGNYIDPYNDIAESLDKYLSNEIYNQIIVISPLNGVANGWFGLGGTFYNDIGFAQVTVDSDSSWMFDEVIFPDAVFVHEVLHCMETRSRVFNPQTAELHNNAGYGFTDGSDEWRAWYTAYMQNTLEDGNGLDPRVYSVYNGDGGGTTTTYTVSFDLNYQDATGTPSSQSITENGLATKPTDPTREDYIFVGWYKEATCENEFDFATEKVVANTTLYVKWEAIQPTTDLSLNVSKDLILLGEDSSDLFFYLSTDLEVQSITLYEGSSTVAEMYDDGNFSLHGDDIAGDSIYSAKYTITATVDSVLSFTAQHQNSLSNSVGVKVYTVISDETLELMEYVNSEIVDLIEADMFSALTEDEKKELAKLKLKELSDTDLIVEESIFFSEESGIFSFQYDTR